MAGWISDLGSGVASQSGTLHRQGHCPARQETVGMSLLVQPSMGSGKPVLAGGVTRCSIFLCTL